MICAVPSSIRFVWMSLTLHDGPAWRQTSTSSFGSFRAALTTDFQAPRSLSVIARQMSALTHRERRDRGDAADHTGARVKRQIPLFPSELVPLLRPGGVGTQQE